MVHQDREHVYFACGRQKPEDPPKLSPMADDTITQGTIESPLSLVYICSQRYSSKIMTNFAISGLLLPLKWNYTSNLIEHVLCAISKSSPLF